MMVLKPSFGDDQGAHLQVHVTGWSADLSVEIGGRDVINHAGPAAVRL
jgi:hypothetical protein